jgi:hypothetical protein
MQKFLALNGATIRPAFVDFALLTNNLNPQPPNLQFVCLCRPVKLALNGL